MANGKSTMAMVGGRFRGWALVDVAEGNEQKKIIRFKALIGK